MFKITAVVICATLALCVFGCGNSSGSSTAATPTTKAKDFDGSAYTDIGSGTFYLRTAAGTSQNGNVPKVTVSSGTSVMQIEADVEGFDGASVTYIYVDGMESTKGNMAKSQRSIDLKGDSLSTGRHTVEAVQFQGDSPSGTVKLYKKAQYEVA